MKYLIIIFYIILIFINYKKNSRINSALIFNSLWSFMTFSAIIFNLQVSDGAFLFIFICNFMYTIPFLISNHTSPKLDNFSSYEIVERRYKKLRKIIIFLNFLGVIYIFIHFGFSYKDFSSLETLANKMSSVAVIRYNTEASLPLINRIINGIVYAACSFDGFIYCKEKKNKYLINLALLFLQMVLLNTKSTLVFGITFFVSGFITSMMLLKICVNFKKILKYCILFIAIFYVFVMINYFRHNMANNIYAETKNILIAYFVGPYSAFSLWLESLGNITDYSFGMNTFAGLFDFIGIHNREIVNEIFLGDVSTNVFTVFRYLIMDYGVVFTILLFYMLGGISIIIESNIKKNMIYPGIYIIILIFLISSFYTSVFKYNVNLLACLLIVLMAIPIKIRLK